MLLIYLEQATSFHYEIPIALCETFQLFMIEFGYRMKEKTMKIGHLKNLLLQRGDTSWHIPFVASITQIVQPKVYVEIGIYKAATLNAVAKHCDHVIGVDINPEAGRFIKAKNAEFVNGDITDFTNFFGVKNTEIDFAFIDGDHRSESVFRDFVGVDRFASKNALILFHDTWPENSEDASDGRCSDSYRVPSLIKERTNGEWASISIPVFPGLTIASRSTASPAWLQQN